MTPSSTDAVVPRTLLELTQLAKHRHGGVGGRVLAEKAKLFGYRVSKATIDRILNGTYQHTPTRATVDALAALAGVTREVAYNAVGMPRELLAMVHRLPDEAADLTPAQQDAVLAVIRQFIAANRHRAPTSKEHQRHGPVTDV